MSSAPPMMRSPRFAGRASITGAVVGVLVTPFMASVWESDGVVWSTTSPVTRVFGPTLESWGALSFGSEDLPYEVYGKFFVFVYLLMLPIVRYVHVLQSTSASAWERRTWRVLWISLIVAAVGDAMSYWAVSLPEPVGEFLWGGGFFFEMQAMLVVLATTSIYGIVSIRIRVIPIWSAVLLTAIIPIVFFSLVGLTFYVPNGVVVPMSIIWAAIGAWVLIATPATPDATPSQRESDKNRTGHA
ncbi:hypothetical protein OAV42_01190 [Ilumatobacter sp.]|nr:hypothetical protein [Ilumatobacter sp.]